MKDMTELQALWGGADQGEEEEEDLTVEQLFEHLPDPMREAILAIVTKTKRKLANIDQMRGFIRGIELVAHVGALNQQFAKAQGVDRATKAGMFELVLSMIFAQCIIDPEISELAKAMGVMRDEE